jgi:cobalt-zinc-cadmium resistance protein CzcA
MRRKIVLCNVVGRDIAGFVEEARQTIARAVDLPPGYHATFGGQFEGQQRALVAFVVLFSSFGSVWQAFLVLLNVPTTLAGATCPRCSAWWRSSASAPRTTSCSWGRSTISGARPARCGTPCSRAHGCASAPS